MKTIFTTAMSVLTVAAVAGCGGTPQPATTVTVASTPSVVATEAPDPVTEPEPTVNSLGYTMLKIAWKKMSATEKQDICVGYAISPASMWRAFKQGSSKADMFGLTKQEFYMFIDKHC